MTADSWPGIDAPARDLQVLADRLGDAGAIVLAELLAKTANQAQALHQAISDREAEIVFGSEWHGGSLSVARRGPRLNVSGSGLPSSEKPRRS
jgi:hypothetical protein